VLPTVVIAVVTTAVVVDPSLPDIVDVSGVTVTSCADVVVVDHNCSALTLAVVDVSTGDGVFISCVTVTRCAAVVSDHNCSALTVDVNAGAVVVMVVVSVVAATAVVDFAVVTIVVDGDVAIRFESSKSRLDSLGNKSLSL
jgi:hypothetical protein